MEAGIRYLPLYPDDSNVIFNKEFFEESENALCKLLPDCTNLSHVVNVIDVKASTGGRILRIVMSGDEGEAIAYLVSDGDSITGRVRPASQNPHNSCFQP